MQHVILEASAIICISRQMCRGRPRPGWTGSGAATVNKYRSQHRSLAQSEEETFCTCLGLSRAIDFPLTRIIIQPVRPIVSLASSSGCCQRPSNQSRSTEKLFFPALNGFCWTIFHILFSKLIASRSGKVVMHS